MARRLSAVKQIASRRRRCSVRSVQSMFEDEPLLHGGRFYGHRREGAALRDRMGYRCMANTRIATPDKAETLGRMNRREADHGS